MLSVVKNCQINCMVKVFFKIYPQKMMLILLNNEVINKGQKKMYQIKDSLFRFGGKLNWKFPMESL